MTAKKPKTKYKTAMLIDDNEIDNFINQKMIESTNFAERIYVNTSGKSALEFMENLQRDKEPDKDLIPDIIFLDLNMPLMDGFQFLQEFEKLGKPITGKSRIVILTTSINPADRIFLNKNKYVLKFINKPLTQAFLDKIMNTAA